MRRITNKWCVPESMVVGALGVLGAMLVPAIREAIYKGTRKVTNWFGLEG